MRTHPWPPALGGEPVSPSDIIRALVMRVARDDTRLGRASLTMDVRSILRIIWALEETFAGCGIVEEKRWLVVWFLCRRMEIDGSSSKRH